MAKKRFGPEQVITKLRRIGVLMGEGKGLRQALREAGITDATYDRWRKEYAGLKGIQAKRFKEREPENDRLKVPVADPSPVAGEGDPEGRDRGKLLSPERRRRAVDHATGRQGVSRRRACRILGQRQPRGAQNAGYVGLTTA